QLTCVAAARRTLESGRLSQNPSGKIRPPIPRFTLCRAPFLHYLFPHSFGSQDSQTMDNLISFLIAAAIVAAFLFFHLRAEKKKHAAAKAAAEKGKIRSDGPQSQHPHIDNNYCIGCANCTTVCPEGDVLGMIGGKAMIINGYKCIGHSLCAEACPVGAITMVLASPSVGASLATLTPAYETTIKNLFIAGELGG